MRHIPLLLLLVSAPLWVRGEGPSRTWAVPGLELTEPMTKTKPGVAKVKASVEGDKAEVVWDVEAQFDDQDVEFSWEVIDQGRAVQVVIPDSRGVIKVAAVAVINGKPTKFAKTYIDVAYVPRNFRQQQQKQPPPKDEEQPKEQPKKATKTSKAKVTDVYFVTDVIDGDPDVDALVKSAGLRNKLRAAGVNPWLFGHDSPSVKANGLEPYVREAGGHPCVIYVTEDRKVRSAKKLTKDSKVEDIIKEAAE